VWRDGSYMRGREGYHFSIETFKYFEVPVIPMIIEHIDRHYLEKQGNRKARNGKLYVSEVGKCPRQIYFEFKGYETEKRKPEVQRALETGDKFHQRMMAALYACPDIEVVASEVDIPVNDLLGGRADAIVGIDDKNYVLELKSIGSYGFKLLDEPKQEHIHQLQLKKLFENMRARISRDTPAFNRNSIIPAVA